MKVAQVLYSGLGGHGSVAFSLIDADKKGEWQPFMAFHGIEMLADTYAGQCNSKEIGYDYIPAVEGKPWKSWAKIFGWLKSKEPDAIILHNISALLPCWFYARIRGVPLIAVEHTPNNVKRTSEWLASRMVMILADRVVLLTPAYRDELRKKFGWFYREDKVRIIPNGIDTDCFVPTEKSPLDESKVVHVGMAARFSSQKRQDILIEMLAQLQQRSELVDFHLTLAGNGETLESLRQKVIQEGMEEYIHFPDYLGGDEMLEWFRSIDIYLHASEGETLSTSLLQAMSMGLPIVASDVPGITNLIGEKEECGVLVENSGKSFADAVIGLTNEPKRAKKISGKARACTVKHYSQSAMFSEYNKIIRECKK